MADRDVIILTPADSYDLLSLQETKTIFDITSSTPDEDAQLQMMISTQSDVISRMCNRVFAYEEVAESWRDLASRRLFLSHWPIKQADVEDVNVNGAEIDASGWSLEPQSGKMSNYNGWNGEPITVTYWGGYKLPDEAPMALKQAAIMLIRQERILMRQAQVAGVRQISHKGARVAFFDPNAVLLAQARGGTAQQTVWNLLYHYIRVEV